ncbi:hypothetical protein ACFC26_07770 [Kitasatospora purpeofusca]
MRLPSLDSYDLADLREADVSGWDDETRTDWDDFRSSEMLQAADLLI